MNSRVQPLLFEEADGLFGGLDGPLGVGDLCRQDVTLDPAEARAVPVVGSSRSCSRASAGGTGRTSSGRSTRASTSVGVIGPRPGFQSFEVTPCCSGPAPMIIDAQLGRAHRRHHPPGMERRGPSAIIRVQDRRLGAPRSPPDSGHRPRSPRRAPRRIPVPRHRRGIRPCSRQEHQEEPGPDVSGREGPGELADHAVSSRFLGPTGNQTIVCQAGCVVLGQKWLDHRG